MNTWSESKQRAIAINKEMKAYDKAQQEKRYTRAGNWGHLSAAPRTGAKWSEYEIEQVVDAINEVIDMKQGQKFSYADLAFVAWTFGRTSDGVWQKLRVVRPLTAKLFWLP